MEKYRSLPFAMYDLAVYLPGGAVILVLAKAALEAITGQNFDVFTGSLQLRDGDTIGMIIHAILWLSASYLAGHLASFISTYVVEKPVHNYFGYPSAIWLDFEQQARPGSIAEDIRKIVRTTYKRSWTEGRKDIVQIGVLLIQLPALIFFAGIFKRGAFGFYSPKLPLGILGDVQAKYAAIGVSVEIKNGTRWEKIIEHHVANNCPIAYGRMYNYLVIYGALRLLSLILITLCWYIILLSFMAIFGEGSMRFDPFRAVSILLSSITYTLSVMAFAKFNRRYFEETIMALLLAK